MSEWQTNCAKNAGILISCEFKSHYSDLHRSVGMADETDLKSVGLYNRVGSSPMSGIVTSGRVAIGRQVELRTRIL